MDDASNFSAIVRRLTQEDVQQPDPQHWEALALSWAIYPSPFLCRMLPKEMVRQKLTKHMTYLQLDDALLRKEGIKALTLAELEFACKDRGLTGDYGSKKDLQNVLEEWLGLSQRLEPSQWLLLHLPSFWTMRSSEAG